MKNKFKNKRVAVLGVILVGLLIIAYKTIFTTPSDEITFVPADVNQLSVENGSPVGAASIADTSNTAATADFSSGSGGGDVESILREIESINFDMSILESQKFKSLQSIEVPLLSLPIGRSNPFAPTGSSNTSKSSGPN